MQRAAVVAIGLLAALGACTDGSPTAPGNSQATAKSRHLATFSADVVQAGNPYYQVFVNGTQGSGFGQYTVMTGPQHPVTISTGSAQNVIYGDGTPGTSFNTIRSYTTHTDYTQEGASPESGFTDFVLDPTHAGVTGTNEAIGSTGFRTTYVLGGPPNTPDKLTIVQVVNVHGTTFQNSTVEVTTTITNNGSSSVQLGLRYLWDTQIGHDDGPTFAPRSPDSSPLIDEATFAPPTFSFYRLEDNDRNTPTPLFDVYGTVTGPTGVTPAPTPPEVLMNASWPNSVGTSFTYTTSPTHDVATSAGDNDNAVLYFWGKTAGTAITLAPGESKSFSQSLVSGETNAPPPFNNAPTATITAPATNSTFDQGTAITFTGTGHDQEDGDLSGNSLTWTSSRDGVIGHGTSFSTSTLSVGTHTITLTASDSQGATGTATITITIRAQGTNQAPTVSITAPAANSSFAHGQTISFAGTGHDPEDGDLSGASLVWTSSIDGQIGTGTSFSTSALSVGIHTITLTGKDSQGATGTASITIRVGYTQVVDANGGDVCALSCNVMMYVPPGDVSGPTTFSVYPTFSPPANANLVAGSAKDIGPANVTFAQPIALGIIYDPAHLPAGVSESSLKLYHLEGGSWVQVAGSGVNTSTHTVFANVTTLGTYAIIGAP